MLAIIEDVDYHQSLDSPGGALLPETFSLVIEARLRPTYNSN
jgi:hypothetical protein